MPPKIIISEFGDTIVSASRFHDHPIPGWDDSLRTPLSSANHVTCGGCVDMVKTSDTHSCLKCRACGLRVVVPNHINTFRELLKEFQNLNIGIEPPGDPAKIFKTPRTIHGV